VTLTIVRGRERVDTEAVPVEARERKQKTK
jgi:hypothetical protein